MLGQERKLCLRIKYVIHIVVVFLVAVWKGIFKKAIYCSFFLTQVSKESFQYDHVK